MPSPHPLVQLARDAIQHHLSFSKPLTLSPHLKSTYPNPTGVFITLFENDKLRGCIGSLKPQTKSLAEEVARNAVLAATKDPRFNPVVLHEIDKLAIQIEIVTPPEPIDDPSGLNPEVDGLIVRSGKKQGVLLPGIEGVDTVEQQIKICRSKGEIKPNDPVTYYRFRVEHHL